MALVGFTYLSRGGKKKNRKINKRGAITRAEDVVSETSLTNLQQGHAGRRRCDPNDLREQ